MAGSGLTENFLNINASTAGYTPLQQVDSSPVVPAPAETQLQQTLQGPRTQAEESTAELLEAGCERALLAIQKLEEGGSKQKEDAVNEIMQFLKLAAKAKTVDPKYDLLSNHRVLEQIRKHDLLYRLLKWNTTVRFEGAFEIDERVWKSGDRCKAVKVQRRRNTHFLIGVMPPGPPAIVCNRERKDGAETAFRLHPPMSVDYQAADVFIPQNEADHLCVALLVETTRFRARARPVVSLFEFAPQQQPMAPDVASNAQKLFQYRDDSKPLRKLLLAEKEEDQNKVEMFEVAKISPDGRFVAAVSRLDKGTRGGGGGARAGGVGSDYFLYVFDTITETDGIDRAPSQGGGGALRLSRVGVGGGDGAAQRRSQVHPTGGEGMEQSAHAIDRGMLGGLAAARKAREEMPVLKWRLRYPFQPKFVAETFSAVELCWRVEGTSSSSSSGTTTLHIVYDQGVHIVHMADFAHLTQEKICRGSQTMWDPMWEPAEVSVDVGTLTDGGGVLRAAVDPEGRFLALITSEKEEDEDQGPAARKGGKAARERLQLQAEMEKENRLLILDARLGCVVSRVRGLPGLQRNSVLLWGPMGRRLAVTVYTRLGPAAQVNQAAPSFEEEVAYTAVVDTLRGVKEDLLPGCAAREWLPQDRSADLFARAGNRLLITKIAEEKVEGEEGEEGDALAPGAKKAEKTMTACVLNMNAGQRRKTDRPWMPRKERVEVSDWASEVCPSNSGKMVAVMCRKKPLELCLYALDKERPNFLKDTPDASVSLGSIATRGEEEYDSVSVLIVWAADDSRVFALVSIEEKNGICVVEVDKEKFVEPRFQDAVSAPVVVDVEDTVDFSLLTVANNRNQGDEELYFHTVFVSPCDRILYVSASEGCFYLDPENFKEKQVEKLADKPAGTTAGQQGTSTTIKTLELKPFPSDVSVIWPSIPSPVAFDAGLLSEDQLEWCQHQSKGFLKGTALDASLKNPVPIIFANCGEKVLVYDQNHETFQEMPQVETVQLRQRRVVLGPPLGRPLPDTDGEGKPQVAKKRSSFSSSWSSDGYMMTHRDKTQPDAFLRRVVDISTSNDGRFFVRWTDAQRLLMAVWKFPADRREEYQKLGLAPCTVSGTATADVKELWKGKCSHDKCSRGLEGETPQCCYRCRKLYCAFHTLKVKDVMIDLPDFADPREGETREVYTKVADIALTNPLMALEFTTKWRGEPTGKLRLRLFRYEKEKMALQEVERLQQEIDLTKETPSQDETSITVTLPSTDSLVANARPGDLLRIVQRQGRGLHMEETKLRLTVGATEVCSMNDAPHPLERKQKGAGGAADVPAFSTSDARDAPPKVWMCRRKHVLEERNVNRYHSCDICRRSIVEGVAKRCNACDYDVCRKCTSVKDQFVCDNGHRTCKVLIPASSVQPQATTVKEKNSSGKRQSDNLGAWSSPITPAEPAESPLQPWRVALPAVVYEDVEKRAVEVFTRNDAEEFDSDEEDEDDNSDDDGNTAQPKQDGIVVGSNPNQLSVGAAEKAQAGGTAQGPPSKKPKSEGSQMENYKPPAQPMWELFRRIAGMPLVEAATFYVIPHMESDSSGTFFRWDTLMLHPRQTSQGSDVLRLMCVSGDGRLGLYQHDDGETVDVVRFDAGGWEAAKGSDTGTSLLKEERLKSFSAAVALGMDPKNDGGALFLITEYDDEPNAALVFQPLRVAEGKRGRKFESVSLGAIGEEVALAMFKGKRQRNFASLCDRVREVQESTRVTVPLGKSREATVEADVLQQRLPQPLGWSLLHMLMFYGVREKQLFAENNQAKDRLLHILPRLLDTSLMPDSAGRSITPISLCLLLMASASPGAAQNAEMLLDHVVTTGRGDGGGIREEEGDESLFPLSFDTEGWQAVGSTVEHLISSLQHGRALEVLLTKSHAVPAPTPFLRVHAVPVTAVGEQKYFRVTHGQQPALMPQVIKNWNAVSTSLDQAILESKQKKASGTFAGGAALAGDPDLGALQSLDTVPVAGSRFSLEAILSGTFSLKSQARQAPVRISTVTIPGCTAKDSTLFESMATCSISEVVRSDVVKNVIFYKWKMYGEHFVVLECSLHVVLLVVFLLWVWTCLGCSEDPLSPSEMQGDPSTLSFFSELNASSWMCKQRLHQWGEGLPLWSFVHLSLAGVVFLMVLVAIVREILEVHGLGTDKYYEDIFNLFDVGGTVATFAAVILDCLEFPGRAWKASGGPDDPLYNHRSPDSLLYIQTFAIFCLWIRLLNLIRPFNAIGTYIRSLVEVSRDVAYFLVVIIIIVLAMACTSFVLFNIAREVGEGGESMEVHQAIGKMYLLGMAGSFETEDWNRSYPLLGIFVLVQLALPIIAFNLLIAVISDTFDRINDRRIETGIREQAAAILTIEKCYIPFFDNFRCLPWPFNALSSKPFWFPEYIMSLAPESAEIGRDFAVDEWEGRIGIMRKEFRQLVQDAEDRIRRDFKEGQRQGRESLDGFFKKPLEDIERRIDRAVHLVEKDIADRKGEQSA